MSRTDPRDPLQAIDEEHGLIAEWAALARAAAGLEPGALDPDRLAWLRGFYGNGVLGHFAYEERHLFPAMLEVCGTPLLAGRIRGLLQEHEELRLRLEILLDDLSSLTGSPGEGGEEREVLGRARLTIASLEAHARAEDTLLGPLLAAHGPHVRAALDRHPWFERSFPTQLP